MYYIFNLEGVTVGEPIQAHVNFDYSKFGYSSKADSSVGFYSEKCGIQEFFDISDFIVNLSNIKVYLRLNLS